MSNPVIPDFCYKVSYDCSIFGLVILELDEGGLGYYGPLTVEIGLFKNSKGEIESIRYQSKIIMSEMTERRTMIISEMFAIYKAALESNNLEIKNRLIESLVKKSQDLEIPNFHELDIKKYQELGMIKFGENDQ